MAGGTSQEVRDLAKLIADWSAPAPDFTFYLFGSRARGDHRPDSDVDLHYVLPLKPTPGSAMWWTGQNSDDCASLRKLLPGPIKWLEQHAPLRLEVEQGKVVHRDRNVVCVWMPPKPTTERATACQGKELNGWAVHKRERSHMLLLALMPAKRPENRPV